LAIGDDAADKDNQGRVQVPGKSTTLPGLHASVHGDLARRRSTTKIAVS
jgi:hypothetical protein